MTGDRAGEGAARRSMAAANQSLGDVGAAVANLEAFLEIAKSGYPASQAGPSTPFLITSA